MVDVKNARNRDRFIDISGIRTGVPITKTRIILIVISILLPFLTSYLPLASYGEKAGLAIGLFTSAMLLLIGGVLHFSVVGIIFCFAAIMLGLLDVPTMQMSLGYGLFFQFVGLCIVGYGVTATPLGLRLSYYMLKKFGKKPSLIVLVLLGISAVLSTLISNFATIVMMSTITNKILVEMDEKPGKSRFGALAMIAIVVGACYGGCGFVQGSPGVNIYGINAIETTTGYLITPAQWAMIGVPFVILLTIVSAVVFLRNSRFDSKEVAMIDPSYYDEKLKELGKMGGSEWRWVLTALSLLVLMLVGIDTNLLMVVFISIALAPFIGTVKPDDAFAKAVPWVVVFSTITLVQLGTVLVNSGVTAWLADLVAPFIQSMSPLAFMLILALVTALMSNWLAALYGIMAITVTAIAPLALAMGYNPAMVCLPNIMLCNFMICFYAHGHVMINFSYGWWKQGEIAKLGTLCTLAGVIIVTVLTYYLAPVLWGVPFLI